jgi:hypothetical protein
LYSVINILLSEAKVALLDAIKKLRETVADPEKVQGRLTKDDKVYLLIILFLVIAVLAIVLL